MRFLALFALISSAICYKLQFSDLDSSSVKLAGESIKFSLQPVGNSDAFPSGKIVVGLYKKRSMWFSKRVATVVVEGEGNGEVQIPGGVKTGSYFLRAATKGWRKVFTLAKSASFKVLSGKFLFYFPRINF